MPEDDMKMAETFLAVGLCAAAATGIWRWTRPSKSPTTTPAPSPIGVVANYVPRLCATSESDHPPLPKGVIAFELDDGRRAVGVCTALLWTERDGGPSLKDPVDLTAVQVGGVLDLRPWLRGETFAGDGFLQFCLRTSRPDAPDEYRVGWARLTIDGLEKRVTSIRVPPAKRVEIVVTTRSGPVPGALVALDADETLPVGMCSFLLPCDERGVVAVSGLEADRRYAARLPDGVGPDRRPMLERIGPADTTVKLGVPLGGEWEYHRIVVRLPLPGTSTKIEAWTTPSAKTASAWPVEHWIGPGRGPDVPLYVMSRKEDKAPAPVRIKFADREPALCDDAKAVERIEFRTDSKKIDVVGPGARQPR